MKNIIKLISVIVIPFLFSSCVIDKIEYNEKGVLFKRFDGGVKTDVVYGHGHHFVAPWDRMIKYNISIQQLEEKTNFLSKNGLACSIEMEIKFRCDPTKIGYLDQEIGKDYPSIIVRPQILSDTRKNFRMYGSKEIDSLEYSTLETLIMKSATAPLEKKYIILDTIIIKNIAKP